MQRSRGLAGPTSQGEKGVHVGACLEVVEFSPWRRAPRGKVGFCPVGRVRGRGGEVR